MIIISSTSKIVGVIDGPILPRPPIRVLGLLGIIQIEDLGFGHVGTRG